MSDRPIAVLVTSVVAAPLVVACCVFGPAVVAWAVAWVSGWVAGLGAVASTGLAIIAAILVFGLIQRSRAKPAVTNGIGGRSDTME